jgi:hypothetical protein
LHIEPKHRAFSRRAEDRAWGGRTVSSAHPGKCPSVAIRRGLASGHE